MSPREKPGEKLVADSGVPATVLRPWYVLGPGHYWAYLLVPLYAVLRRLSATRDGAERLGLVTRAAMVDALISAMERPMAIGVRIVDVPEIRSAHDERLGT